MTEKWCESWQEVRLETARRKGLKLPEDDIAFGGPKTYAEVDGKLIDATENFK